MEKPLGEWRDEVLPDDVPKVDALWERALSQGSDQTAEHLELRYKGGNWVQYEVSVLPMSSRNPCSPMISSFEPSRMCDRRMALSGWWYPDHFFSSLH